jgi:hypothetical protein
VKSAEEIMNMLDAFDLPGRCVMPASSPGSRITGPVTTPPSPTRPPTHSPPTPDNKTECRCPEHSKSGLTPRSSSLMMIGIPTGGPVTSERMASASQNTDPGFTW